MKDALTAVASLFGPGYSRNLLHLLKNYGFRPWEFLAVYWQTQNFNKLSGGHGLTVRELNAVRLLQTGMLAQIVAGIVLIILGLNDNFAGGIYFGIALVVSYPVVWAHTLALATFIWWAGYFLAHPKKLGKGIVCLVLESQVKALRAKHEFAVVAVAGSVGKTSTKLAIAELLSQTKRVRWQSGNYNDRVTVPLVFFGQKEPSLMNVMAWRKTFKANKQVITGKFPYDVVVVELGTDGPGQLQKFAYIRPDISVLTAVSPEHMEFFKTLDGVAAEETAVFGYSKRVLVNGDDIPAQYLANKEFKEYSLMSPRADYYAKVTPEDLNGQVIDIRLPDGEINAANVQYIGRQGAKFALAASAVAHELGVKNADIKVGLKHLHHFAGRMQVLPGINGSTIIDDTYNSSPLAAKAALDVLYSAKTSQRIAILGSMNELGNYSPEAHREVGQYCDPDKLDYVITIGKEAERHLAPAAEKRGCKVKSFASPYEAGEFVKNELKKGAAVLAKGSQNGVFAEESLKVLLKNPEDGSELVRQSPYWLGVKRKQFPSG